MALAHAMPVQPFSTCSTHIYGTTTTANSVASSPNLAHRHAAIALRTLRRHNALVVNATDVQEIAAVATYQKDATVIATPISAKHDHDEAGRIAQAESDSNGEPPYDYDYGAVDPKSGLNGCEITGIVIGCILIFMILVYLGLKFLVLREAKERLDYQRDLGDIRDRYTYTDGGRWVVVSR